MKKIKFLGAAGDVTGSSFLLTSSNNAQYLVDFGMFQGGQKSTDLNYSKLQFNPAALKGVFLTHAHLDHCGRLPLLSLGGYQGKIYMTAPTRALIELSLLDSAKIARENDTYPPLYDADQVEKVLKMVEIVEYDKQFHINDVSATYRNAGHILGSASIEFIDQTNGEKIVFSGDLGNTPEDLIQPTEYIHASEYVIMESTYGDKNHPHEDVSTIMQEEINGIEKTGGVLLIPAFSLERTQEVLHRIHHLKKDGKVRDDTPVFLDSPMGIHATIIFRDFKSFYNDELRNHTSDPFNFPGLIITEDARDSKEIIRAMDPKVIIAGSGMMSGGRIMHHAMNYLDRPTTRVLFVGYQAEETIGRKILEGKKSVWLGKRQVSVRASVREIKSMSSHADQQNLLKWLGYIKNAKKVFLVHGEEKQREILSQNISKNIHMSISLPQLYDEISLE